MFEYLVSWNLSSMPSALADKFIRVAVQVRQTILSNYQVRP
ncbi:hypothetical protein imdm_1068 [gamma proteobacterium IMCC2047]|nr:hypothetical protein imdm_1068 [gamma proteobacterium IMCC2047]